MHRPRLLHGSLRYTNQCLARGWYTTDTQFMGAGPVLTPRLHGWKLLLSVSTGENRGTRADIHKPEQSLKTPPGRGRRGARVRPRKVTDSVSQQVEFEMA